MTLATLRKLWLVVLALVLANGVLCYCYSASTGHAYTVELTFSDRFNRKDEDDNSKRWAFQEFDNSQGSRFEIDTPEGPRAESAISGCRLDGEFWYQDDGLRLSPSDPLLWWQSCGNIQVRMNFPDLNTSGMPFPGNTTNLYVRGITIYFRNFGSTVGGGVHKMSRGRINWDWGDAIAFEGEGIVTVDFKTGTYYYGELRSINYNPDAVLRGIDGFAIQACGGNDIRVIKVFVHVFWNVT